jgi:mannitol/fructose-specific phosphotransferase system IIA component (Ntr-type)
MRGVKLGDLIDRRDVAIGLRGSDIADAAAQLLRQTLPRRGIAPGDVQRMVDAVMAREREVPTACGAAAIPHARDASIGSFLAAIGTNAGGVVEGKPQPRVLIAFLSPAAQRAEHLAFLASLSRLASDAKTMDAIAGAASADEVVALLKG